MATNINYSNVNVRPYWRTMNFLEEQELMTGESDKKVSFVSVTLIDMLVIKRLHIGLIVTESNNK